MERVKRSIHASGEEVFPYTGKGVTAAILDSGIAMHPDLLDRVIAFKDFLSDNRYPLDDYGHGTHVAGCLCGNGSCSQGRLAGVAPDCRIVVCRILNAQGTGNAEDMMAAISYVIKTRHLYETKILNISIGLNDPEDLSVYTSLQAHLKEAWEAGLLVVVAAGNKGPEANSMSPLGHQPNILAVGCYDGERREEGSKDCALYSGRGPDNLGVRKPDIVAPGTGIESCSAAFRRLAGGRVQRAYRKMDGTSMAVPLVSGAAALLWQKYPGFTNEQIRKQILWSARDLSEPWNYQGWGMLDVRNMLFCIRKD